MHYRTAISSLLKVNLLWLVNLIFSEKNVYPGIIPLVTFKGQYTAIPSQTPLYTSENSVGKKLAWKFKRLQGMILNIEEAGQKLSSKCF